MPDRVGGRLDLRSLLAAVEAGPPVAAVDVFAAELGDRLGAEEVTFLISDFKGSALVRLSHHRGGGGRRRQGADAAERVPLAGTPYEHVVRTQRLQVHPADEGTRVLAPVTDRGDVIGVLEMLLPADPDPATVDYIAAAAHALGYVVIVNRRFTDLFEWGQRSQPFSLAAEIQRRLLPTSLTCEAGQFTVAGAVEPAGYVGGDTFDYSLDRDTLHVSLTDAMGHEEDAALLASLLVGSLRNSRRSGATLAEQAARANSALLQHARPDQFVTDGVLERNAATADVIGLVAATGDLHPREVVQEINRAVLRAVDGKLRDDATVLCLDWYGGGERDREADAGANQHGASPPRADS